MGFFLLYSNELFWCGLYQMFRCGFFLGFTAYFVYMVVQALQGSYVLVFCLCNSQWLVDTIEVEG